MIVKNTVYLNDYVLEVGDSIAITKHRTKDEEILIILPNGLPLFITQNQLEDIKNNL